MEDVDTISVAVSGIDINKVEPLDSRRVVAFINHFLCTSVTFLNQFATKCEVKLDQMQQKLSTIESRLKILECKLESIPQSNISLSSTANNISQSTTTDAVDTSQLEKLKESHQNTNNVQPSENLLLSKSNEHHVSKNNSNTEADGAMLKSETAFSEGELDKVPSSSDTTADNGDDKPSLRDDPRYSKYFKMVCVGVPVPAIKLKMKSEGVDPSILDL